MLGNFTSSSYGVKNSLSVFLSVSLPLTHTYSDFGILTLVLKLLVAHVSD